MKLRARLLKMATRPKVAIPRISSPGLTLLELMIVVLLIGLLSAILIPALAYLRESSRRTACSHYLRSLSKAMFMYADVPANEIFPAAGSPEDPMLSLGLLYNKYVADPRILSCPSRPVSPQSLAAMVPGGRAVSSFAYDPGHGPNDKNVPMLGDMKGAGNNSDNHGRDAGQNIVTSFGVDEWLDSADRPREDGKVDSIYKLNPELPRREDAYLRQ